MQFGKIKAWFKWRALGFLSVLMLLAQEDQTPTLDLSGITSVMTTLIYAILPLLVIVMVFKVFGNVVKSIGDIF